MTREIKFRAWDGEKMGYFKLDDICANGNVIYTDNGNNFDTEMPIMQFTGLHDKNNKEIYEGDILNWKATVKKTGKVALNVNVEVFFDEDCPGYYVKPNNMDERLFKSRMYLMEVIGNIHEDKDLLKK